MTAVCHEVMQERLREALQSAWRLSVATLGPEMAYKNFQTELRCAIADVSRQPAGPKHHDRETRARPPRQAAGSSYDESARARHRAAPEQATGGKSHGKGARSWGRWKRRKFK
jgi:hypothetical protein